MHIFYCHVEVAIDGVASSEEERVIIREYLFFIREVCAYVCVCVRVCVCPSHQIMGHCKKTKSWGVSLEVRHATLLHDAREI